MNNDNEEFRDWPNGAVDTAYCVLLCIGTFVLGGVIIFAAGVISQWLR